MTQVLTLSTTSLHNLVLSTPNDALFYEVVTPRHQRASTVVSKLDPDSREFEVVAETQNDTRTRKPHEVRLRGEEFRAVGEFMNVDAGRAKGEKGRFRGKDGKFYTWRVRKGRLELIRDAAGPDADPSESKPVATFRTHRRYCFFLRMSRYPSLTIEPSIIETLDSVILSFLIIQRQRK